MQAQAELKSLEGLITTKFVRPEADVDDTIPFELYSRPYEKIELAEPSAPYAMFEVEMFEVPVEIDLSQVAPIPDPLDPRDMELRVQSNLVCDERERLQREHEQRVRMQRHRDALRRAREGEATQFMRVEPAGSRASYWFIALAMGTFALGFGAMLAFLVW